MKILHMSFWMKNKFLIWKQSWKQRLKFYMHLNGILWNMICRFCNSPTIFWGCVGQFSRTVVNTWQCQLMKGDMFILDYSFASFSPWCAVWGSSLQGEIHIKPNSSVHKPGSNYQGEWEGADVPFRSECSWMARRLSTQLQLLQSLQSLNSAMNENHAFNW